MATTVNEIYYRVAYDLLEDGNLVLGTVTPGQFLDYLEEAILEFCQQGGLCKKIYTQTILTGQQQYLVPDDILQVQNCFVGGKHIEPTTLEELQNNEYEWAKQSGPTRSWFQDGLPESMVQVFPTPIYDGTLITPPTPTPPPFGEYGEFNPTDNNLTTVGSSGPTTITPSFGGDIPEEVPDSFTPYLVYRILSRIFSQDGEAKDTQRAIYCNARWLEGMSLAQVIRGEALAEERGMK